MTRQSSSAHIANRGYIFVRVLPALLLRSPPSRASMKLSPHAVAVATRGGWVAVRVVQIAYA